MPGVNDEFTWTNFESHSCTTYATREYVAELNVSSWNRHRMEICMATSAVIHGRPYWPFSCEVASRRFWVLQDSDIGIALGQIDRTFRCQPRRTRLCYVLESIQG